MADRTGRHSRERKWTRDSSGRLVSAHDQSNHSNHSNSNNTNSNRRRSRSRSRSRSRERNIARPQPDASLPQSSSSTTTRTTNRGRNHYRATNEQHADDPDLIDMQRSNDPATYNRRLQELHDREARGEAVRGTNLEQLSQVLSDIRHMMHTMSNRLGEERAKRFTLKLSVSLRGVMTIFDEIKVTQMESIPRRNVSVEEEAENATNDSFECGICIERFKQKDVVSTLGGCNHEFHEDCVMQWIRKKGKCPMCRGKVPFFKCDSDIGVVYI